MWYILSTISAYGFLLLVEVNLVPKVLRVATCTKTDGKTVLLVEDDIPIAINETSILKKHGFDVFTVYTSHNVVETIQNNHIDLILMDIDLGDGTMNGPQLAEYILKERELPIVFLTAHPEKEYVDRVKNVTNYGYILKSAGEFVLVESICMALHIFEARQKLKRENELRRQAEEELTAIYTDTPVPMIIVDNHLKIKKTNAMAASFTNSTEEELLDKRPGDALRCSNRLFSEQGCTHGPMCSVCRLREVVTDTFKNGRKYRKAEAELPLEIDQKPKRRNLHISTSLVHHGEKQVCIVIIEDITERKRLEEALRQSREKYRLIIDNANETITSVDKNGRLLFANRASANHRNCKPEELIGKTLWEIMPCEDADQRYKNIQEVIRNGQPKTDVVQRHFPHETRYFQSHIQPIRENSGEIESVLILSTDITEQKEKEQQLEYMNTLLSVEQESSIDGIVVVNAEDRIVSYNNRFSEMWRIPADIISTGSGDSVLHYVRPLLVDFDSFAERIASLYRHKDEIGCDEIELTDGRILHRYTAPLFGPHAIYYGRIWFYRDITGYREAVKDREMLLQEINHRVKNNLANITALAHLELGNEEKSKEQSIGDLINRIESIGLMHELLYTGNSLHEIEVDRYIETLTRRIHDFYRDTHATQVEFRFDIEPLTFSAKLTTTIGIILSELLTNTFKHAVVDGIMHITISLYRQAEELVLVYSDSGTGLSNNVRGVDDLKQGTGLLLIQELVSGIDGTLRLDNTDGTTFSIVFKQ